MFALGVVLCVPGAGLRAAERGLPPGLPSYYGFSTSIGEYSSKLPIKKKIFFLSIEVELLF